MAEITLEALGLDREKLERLVVERAAANMLSGVAFDEDGDQVEVASGLKRKLDVAIKDQVDAAIRELAEKHIHPNIAQHVEAVTMQATNRWGEKIGQPQTFIEFLVARIDAYIVEPVNSEGKTQAESGGYSWSKSGTRIAHMVDKHLKYSIETAVTAALKEVNSKIAAGLAETVRVQLAQALAKLK